MKLKIKTILGLACPIEVEVNPKESVELVKEKAAMLNAIDPEVVVLYYKNKKLDDSKTLDEYGIQESDTLELLPKHAYT